MIKSIELYPFDKKKKNSRNRSAIDKKKKNETGPICT